MKLVAKREALVAATAAAARAAVKGSDVLSACLLFAEDGTLSITGTDRDLTITAKIELADLVGSGAVLVPADLLNKLASAADAENITLSQDKDEALVQVSAGRASWRLNTYSTNLFPKVSHLEGGEPVDAGDFLTAVNRVLPAVSRDKARPVLGGMHFEGNPLRLVATDSYRLSVLDTGFANSIDNPVTVPGTALTEVARLKTEKLAISADAHGITFTSDWLKVTSRLIEGAYPDYRVLIERANPDSRSAIVTVEREEMLKVLKRVELLAPSNHVVALDVSESGVRLTANSSEFGNASEPLDEATYEGPDMRLGFNANYLAQGLEATGGSTVSFFLESPEKVIVVRPAGDKDFTQLLMPVRIS